MLLLLAVQTHPPTPLPSAAPCCTLLHPYCPRLCRCGYSFEDLASHPLAILLHADAATGQVQEAALQAIATLTSYARHQEAISAVGVLRPLLRILSEGSQSTMSRSAAEALRNLARTEKMKEVLREDGGFAPIFNGACWLDVLAPAHFRHLLANPHPHVRALTPMGPLPLPAAPRPAAPCPDAPHPAAPRSKRPSLKTPLVRSPFRSAAG